MKVNKTTQIIIEESDFTQLADIVYNNSFENELSDKISELLIELGYILKPTKAAEPVHPWTGFESLIRMLVNKYNISATGSIKSYADMCKALTQEGYDCTVVYADIFLGKVVVHVGSGSKYNQRLVYGCLKFISPLGADVQIVNEV